MDGMSEGSSKQTPFATLGKHLRYLREQHSESLAEVSGAVEIDERSLARIEDGVERPAEDILLLLINHFDMQDQEAVQLWELAGYDNREQQNDLTKLEDIIAEATGQAGQQRPVMVVMGMDVRTMYSDNVELVASSSGITFTFNQDNVHKQSVPVSRIGMSYDQAERLCLALQKVILKGKHQRQPKLLPPPTDGVA